MAFRATFIGINKHQDPGIQELTGATHDARALYALFNDTFSGIDARLLIDESATLSSIRAALDASLGEALPDDVVVLTFAGHGTPGHQIVAFDTDRGSPGDTSLSMTELAERFRSSKARAVLCILDCCFSGAAPARVLDGTPLPRAHLVDYSAFAGTGRFLIAAASPTQPAWEEPSSGHGLLTRSVIEVLTEGSGTNDITAAVSLIVSKTRALAQSIGEQQDPCFIGAVEGGLELPILVRGALWQKLFPDLSAIQVSKDFGQLAAFNIPPAIIHNWEARYTDGLNDLQLAAINRHRVLNGEPLLVVAPTSSGKTLIGEIAAVRAALNGKKAVFLLPYRALVNEKYEDFNATYGSAGLRVIRCAGDFTDQTGLLLSGRYDLALLTFEMFLGLAVGNPHVLKRIGLVVLDEAQFITDPSRGITVELLLTLILASGSKTVRPQIIALSAVIGGVNEFDAWLDCDKLIWSRRPVPLVEGVLDRLGILQTLDPDGNESETQLLPRHAIRQRKKEPSAQDVIVPLVQSLLRANEKVLIFRNRRGPAEGCARYLADELGLPPASAALATLPAHDLSTSADTLKQCLAGGTAFHNSNLTRDERVVVERNFRDRQGGIHALAATTTLAAGINTPASTVILAEQEFIGEDGRPFTVAEYKNMAGRAGRLGFNETGKSIILADTPLQRRQLFVRYIRGTPESIRSSFADHDVRTWIIRLLSQVRAVKETDVSRLLASTFGGFLAQKTDPTWKARSEHEIANLVVQFVTLGLLERQDGDVQLTLLGRACGQSSLSFESAMRLIEAAKSIPPVELSAFSLIGLLQILPEADNTYTPIGLKKSRKESIRISDASTFFGHSVAQALQRWAGDEFTYWARCKRAAVLADWINGTAIQDIEQRYSMPFGGQVALGDIMRFADATRFHFRSAHQILSILLAMTPDKEAEFELMLQRLEFGVPADVVELMAAPIGLSRGECLTLISYGVRSLSALGQQSQEFLERLFGASRAANIATNLDRLKMPAAS
jgi:helicase